MAITATKENMKTQLWDIIVDISWANISTKYFGRSRSWLSQKLSGMDGNGKETEFTDQEKEILKAALTDLSNRIRKCADDIE